MFEITIRDSMTDEITRRINGAIEGLDDFRPLWRKMRPRWYQTRLSMFRSDGREYGWPSYDQTPERERYVFAKSNITGIPVDRLRVLRWTPGRERLFPSLTNPRDPYTVYDVTRRSVAMGTAVPYAANHDAGRGRAPVWAGGHAIPRRRLVELGASYLRELRVGVGTLAAEVARELGTTRAGLTSAEVDAL